jgi:DNA-directed RNA polymerase subunit RPC12/RpoP
MAVTGGLCVVAILFLAVAFDSGWPFHTHTGVHFGGYLVRGVCMALTLVVGLVAYKLSKRQLTLYDRRKGAQDPVFQPGEEWLAARQRDAFKYRSKYDGAAIDAFVKLTVDPARYRSRVSETVDLDGNGFIQQVSVEFTLPDSALDAEYLYLPILSPLKGELIDNFRLCHASGASATNLSYDETTILAALGIESLLYSASYRALGEEMHVGVDKDVLADGIILLKPLASRGHISNKDAEALVNNRLQLIHTKLVGRRTKKILRMYLTSLTVTYPIVAVVPRSAVVGGRVLMKYERTVLPPAKRGGRQGRLRLFLGLRPHQLAVPVNLALTAASYHLRVNGLSAGDKYVSQQSLRCIRCQRRVQRNWVGSPQSCPGCSHQTLPSNVPNPDTHYRLRQRRGQSYAHLYMRGYASSKLRDLELKVRFKEIPPGSRAYAAATAMVTTIFVGAIGYMVGHGIGTGSELPALILALPVAAVSWFSSTTDSDKLVGSSLLARLSLILSSIVSFAAIIVYLVFTHHPTEGVTRLSPNGSGVALLGVGNFLWLTLVSVSLMNFIYISYRFVLRLWYYRLLRNKQDRVPAEYVTD